MSELSKYASVFRSCAQVLGLGESQITRSDVENYLSYLKGKGINYRQIIGWKNAKYTVLSVLQNILDGKDITQLEIDWGKQDLITNYKENPEYFEKIVAAKVSLG